MKAIANRRETLPQLAALVAVLVMGVTTSHAPAAELTAIVQVFWEGGPAANIRYTGEVADDGSVLGTFFLTVGGRPYVGTFRGFLDEENDVLTFNFTSVSPLGRPDVLVLLIFGEVIIDLDTGYAETNGSRTGQARVDISD